MASRSARTWLWDPLPIEEVDPGELILMLLLQLAEDLHGSWSRVLERHLEPLIHIHSPIAITLSMNQSAHVLLHHISYSPVAPALDPRADLAANLEHK
jgi:hypothetical protein